MAADKGHVDAMFNYVLMLDKVNKLKAVQYFKMTADKGDTKSTYNLAYKFANSDGINVNKVEAAHLYKIAADKGHINSMHYYALMLYQSDGINVNKQEAARYFKMAADK